VTVSIAITLVLFVFLLWKLPWWLDGKKLGGITPGSAAVITGMRTALVAVGAALVAGVGLWISYKTHLHSQKVLAHTEKSTAEQAALTQASLEHSRNSAVTQAELTRASLEQAREVASRQEELSREQQVTDRYVKAISLLASEKMTERLGGIYALERVMVDSEKDHDTVVKVLAAFVRQRAVRPKPSNEDDDSAVAGQAAEVQADVHAAVQVIGARPSRSESFSIDFRKSYLPDYSFSGCNFRRVRFSKADLTNILFQNCDFRDAWFDDCDLTSAWFLDCKFNGAHVTGSHAERSVFKGSNFTEAYLFFTNFSEADFSGVVLKDSDLDGTDLTGVKGLSVESLLTCKTIDSRAKLDSELANDERVKSKISSREA
jgi:uncharacterized protein YjbI with pentapeptide repeats